MFDIREGWIIRSVGVCIGIKCVSVKVRIKKKGYGGCVKVNKGFLSYVCKIRRIEDVLV